VGGPDLYYGGTAYDNSAGLGVQVQSGAERGEQPEVTWIEPPPLRPAPEGALRVVPRTLLYDRGTMFGHSALMRPRVAPAHVELSSTDAGRLGIADGDAVLLRQNGHAVPLVARVNQNGDVPTGVALLPRDLGPLPAEGYFAAVVEKA
jgi:anaerobic selenocysteine-containing dehydrogenase